MSLVKTLHQGDWLLARCLIKEGKKRILFTTDYFFSANSEKGNDGHEKKCYLAREEHEDKKGGSY